MNPIDELREKYSHIEGERFFDDVFRLEEYSSVREHVLTTVIDVGALAGEFGAYIYDLAGTIYAIEPHPEYFKELDTNVKEFQLEKMKPYNLALSNTNGMGRISLSGIRGGDMLIDTASPDAADVQTKTLAQFMKDEGITHVDVLKIDIEGNETLVIESEDFPSVAPHIDFIIGEHLTFAQDRLKNLGFTFRHDKLGNMIFERL